MNATKISTLSLLSVALMAMPPYNTASAKTDPSIEAAIVSFSQAGDRRDPTAVDRHTHADFRVVFAVRGKPGVQVLDRKTYKNLLAAEKIGGGHRTVKILNVSQQDGLAVAKVRLERNDATFETVSTLVKGQNGWKLIQEAVVLIPKGT